MEINWDKKAKWKREMFEHFGEACAFTGKKENITLDHLLPRDKSYGDVESQTNLLPICGDVNTSKGNKHLFEWFETNGDRFGISSDKFNSAIEYVASKLGMTFQEYKDYYDQRFYRETFEEYQAGRMKEFGDVGVIDFRKSKFVMVPRKLAEDGSLTHRDKITYMALCLFANNDTKQAYPSVDTLAGIICSSRSTVFRSIKVLEQRGYIKRVNRFYGAKKQTTNAYILLDVD